MSMVVQYYSMASHPISEGSFDIVNKTTKHQSSAATSLWWTHPFLGIEVAMLPLKPLSAVLQPERIGADPKILGPALYFLKGSSTTKLLWSNALDTFGVHVMFQGTSWPPILSLRLDATCLVLLRVLLKPYCFLIHNRSVDTTAQTPYFSELPLSMLEYRSVSWFFRSASMCSEADHSEAEQDLLANPGAGASDRWALFHSWPKGIAVDLVMKGGRSTGSTPLMVGEAWSSHDCMK